MSYLLSRILRAMFAVIALLIIVMFPSCIEASISRSELNAAYLFRLAENIQWPNAAQITEYRIHIIDSDRTTAQVLKNLTRGKRLHGKPFYISRSRSSSVPDGAHLVFLASSRSGVFSEVLRQLESKSILLISDDVDNKRQIMINLFETGNQQVRFEINKANILNHNLGVNPDIVLLGGTEIDVAKLYLEGQKQLQKLELQVKELNDKRLVLQQSAEQSQKEADLLAKNLEAQKQAVNREHQQLEQAEAETQLQRKELQRQSILIAEQESAIGIGIERLMEAEAKYQAIQKKLDSQQDLVVKLEQAVANEQARFKAAVVQTRELQTQIQNQEQLVAEKLQKYEQLTQQVQQQQESLTEQQSKIQQRANTINEQDTTIKNQLNMLAQQSDTIGEQRNYITGMSIAVGLGVVQAILVLISYRAKQRANNRLSQQNLILEQTTKQLTAANKAAEQANQAKTIFLTTMSHELRTPLNAILGFSQMMQRDVSLNESHKEKLGIINSSGEHLLGLINDVLELSKIEAGRIVLNNTTFDLHRMLDELASIFRERFEGNGVQLKVERDESLPQFVYADQSKVRQILINLLGNALKFTSQGMVSLTASQGKPGCSQQKIALKFDVEDTGIGIAEDDFSKIFTPFEQAADGARKEGSTGLGLSISQRFAQLMGGRITFTSQQGVGSTFSVEIEVIEGKQSDVEASQLLPVVASLAPDQPEIRTLVVDDNYANRLMLQKMLSDVGFTVREAADGQQALDLFHQWQPQLMLLDVKMPVIDGSEVTKRIKASPEGKDVVIIVISASVFEEQKQQLLELGANAYINKPVREDILFTEIQRHLHVSYLYREEADSFVSIELTRNDVIKLPQTLRRAFYQALSVGDVDELTRLATEAGRYDSAVGRSLHSMVESFEMNTLQQLFVNDNDV